MGDTDVKVGEKIKKFRESAGISLAEMAERTGFSPAYLSQLENHLISPPLGALIKIARCLEIEIGTLFGQKGSAPFTIVRKNEGRRPVRLFIRIAGA
jgi:transcriptional regulator with XRE-family HTH domain